MSESDEGHIGFSWEIFILGQRLETADADIVGKRGISGDRWRYR
jgi:hypothetical protein